MQDPEQDKAEGNTSKAGGTVSTGIVRSLDSVRIAGPKTVREWNEFKSNLKPGNPQSPWKEAFNDYFLARLSSRYLQPIKLLQKHGTLEGEGFSITAIHCSLIEFLQSTFEGKSYVHLPRGKTLANPAEEYSISSEMFVRFLTTHHPFADSFTKEHKEWAEKDSIALHFYRKVRCGLFHEARTNGGWKILAKSQNGDLISIVSATEKIIYRDNFHWGLLEFIECYKEQLLSVSSIQDNFKRRFDRLACES